jgi:hypothetical protein
MTEQEAYDRADELRRLVFERTGLQGRELVCPREKSFMTPCIARDGGTAVAFRTDGTAICVGCETSLSFQIEREREKHPVK